MKAERWNRRKHFAKMKMERTNKNMSFYIRNYSSGTTAVVEPTSCRQKWFSLATTRWPLVPIYLYTSPCTSSLPPSLRVRLASLLTPRLLLALRSAALLLPCSLITLSPSRFFSSPPPCALVTVSSPHCHLNSASPLLLWLSDPWLPRRLVATSPPLFCLFWDLGPLCYLTSLSPCRRHVSIFPLLIRLRASLPALLRLPPPLCASVFRSCCGYLPLPCYLSFSWAPHCLLTPSLPQLRLLSASPIRVSCSLLPKNSASATLSSTARLRCLLLCCTQAQHPAYTSYGQRRSSIGYYSDHKRKC